MQCKSYALFLRAKRSKSFSLLALSASFAVLLLSSPSRAETIFGPKTYSRSSGPPAVITDNFSATPGSQYTLILTNNGLSDSATELAADSFVYLNGESLVGTNNFGQATQTLEVPLTLQDTNTLEVEVRGAEAGSFTIKIETNP